MQLWKYLYGCCDLGCARNGNMVSANRGGGKISGPNNQFYGILVLVLGSPYFGKVPYLRMLDSISFGREDQSHFMTEQTAFW